MGKHRKYGMIIAPKNHSGAFIQDSMLMIREP